MGNILPYYVFSKPHVVWKSQLMVFLFPSSYFCVAPILPLVVACLIGPWLPKDLLPRFDCYSQ